METLKIVLTVVHLVIAFALIVSVLFQSGKSQGLSGTIAGGAETFFGKNKGKTMDGMLAKLTVILAILFVITSVTIPMVNEKISGNVEGNDVAISNEAGEDETLPGDGEVAPVETGENITE